MCLFLQHPRVKASRGRRNANRTEGEEARFISLLFTFSFFLVALSYYHDAHITACMGQFSPRFFRQIGRHTKPAH
jgi:hypothetical protein